MRLGRQLQLPEIVELHASTIARGDVEDNRKAGRSNANADRPTRRLPRRSRTPPARARPRHRHRHFRQPRDRLVAARTRDAPPSGDDDRPEVGDYRSRRSQLRHCGHSTAGADPASADLRMPWRAALLRVRPRRLTQDVPELGHGQLI